MCRLLGYLGLPLQLDHLLLKPDHSLIVQSYQPREMTAGLLNADGFGIGWYHDEPQTDPFIYRNVLPIWNDPNLISLSRYIQSGCYLANVRSATPGQSIDMLNCQPFQAGRVLAVHNGYIENFRKTLYRPLRERFSDEVYLNVNGTTDSEHIFGLLMSLAQASPQIPMAAVMQETLMMLAELADTYAVGVSANLIVGDGQQLVACRFAWRSQDCPAPAPTLYWLQGHDRTPEGTIVASEPLFDGNWQKLPERTILTIQNEHEVEIHQF